MVHKNGFKLEVKALISKDVSYVTEQYAPRVSKKAVSWIRVSRRLQ